MIILGIDPGLATMGYGVIETDGIRHKLIQYGALITQPRQAMPQRLRSIFTGVNQLMDMYNPAEVAVEELFFFKKCHHGHCSGHGARGGAGGGGSAHRGNL